MTACTKESEIPDDSIITDSEVYIIIEDGANVNFDITDSTVNNNN